MATAVAISNNASATTSIQLNYSVATVFVPPGESRRVEIPETLLSLGIDLASAFDVFYLGGRCLTSSQTTTLHGTLMWRELQ